MADVFQAEVITLKVSEGAAYAAALQAMWCWHNQQGKSTSIDTLTDRLSGSIVRNEPHPTRSMPPYTKNYSPCRTLGYASCACLINTAALRKVEALKTEPNTPAALANGSPRGLGPSDFTRQAEELNSFSR